jgi:two-component system sensor histidine kinase YesM
MKFKFLRINKIQFRIIFFFIILIFGALAITGIFTYYYANKALMKKTSLYSSQIVIAVADDIKTEIESSVNIIDAILYTDDVQQKFQMYYITRDLSYINEFMDTIISQIPTESTISEIRILTNSNDLVYKKRKYVLMPEEMDDLIYVAKTYGNRQILKSVKLESGRYGITFVSGIYSVDTFEIIGHLFITIDEKSLSDNYSTINMGEGSSFFIIDSHGNVLSSRNTEIPVNKEYRHNEVINEILYHHNTLENNVFSCTMENKKHLVVFSRIEDCFLVVTIPYTYINSDIKTIGAVITIIGVLCFLFSVLFSVILSRSIASPLKNLLEQMNKVKQGNLEVFVDDSGKDEIREVSDNFNIMIKQLKKLVIDIKEEERQKTEEKIKRLQAQINPHFLCNTLNTVKWLATMQNAQNINTLVTSLIQLCQVNMDSSKNCITIEEEIEYVKNYINIQQYKYCDKFTVFYDVDNEVLKYKIPKITLQPIVENAIIHGIKPLKGQGEISISAHLVKNHIEIFIADNGVGFKEEVKYDNNMIELTEFNGMGIKNVNERLRMMFGNMYGLSLESTPNTGTTIKVIIPAHMED